jgi:hypothetical protein
MEVGSNRIVCASQVDAAGQIRAAGLEAAKLRQAAAVGREISREVGQGMRDKILGLHKCIQRSPKDTATVHMFYFLRSFRERIDDPIQISAFQFLELL